MAGDHPDQLRLSAYLDHAEAAIRDRMASTSGPLALRLDVALPHGVELLRHHDLDNYLFPLVTRLGAGQFVSVWGAKAVGDVSAIRVERARQASAIDEAGLYHALTTRSAETVAWKQELRDQLAGATELADGPLELQLAFRVGPGRNWANLWKPTIDSLDRILGSDGGRPWNPRDGRITRL